MSAWGFVCGIIASIDLLLLAVTQDFLYAAIAGVALFGLALDSQDKERRK